MTFRNRCDLLEIAATTGLEVAKSTIFVLSYIDGDELELWATSGVLRHAQIMDSKLKADMVYLVLNAQSLQEILDTSELAKMSVWFGANALSEAEFAKLQGSNFTRFTYSFENCDNATIQRAVSTITEHHPGERVWVECVLFED